MDRGEKKAFDRLNNALQGEERPLAKAKNLPVYNTDKMDGNFKNYTDTVLNGEKKSISFLGVLVILLALAVLAAAAYAFFLYREVFL